MKLTTMRYTPTSHCPPRPRRSVLLTQRSARAHSRSYPCPSSAGCRRSKSGRSNKCLNTVKIAAKPSLNPTVREDSHPQLRKPADAVLVTVTALVLQSYYHVVTASVVTSIQCMYPTSLILDTGSGYKFIHRDNLPSLNLKVNFEFHGT